ncbi:Regulator of protease activity HflC, stomatin/prohibitin superfamily [Anaerocolumna jejuensis DSM 15929]|uniref:Regulator of protease activity HflC, stomatin/prohibitin superfamily n=2 Tax=Anaerocolumna TaxID=1843210 RepID=A0A1M6UWF5_9FIRM|nr:Regulator of protease activity HflC, stomatin/prohibitin superfamily [Anaerocolumna jejuensis DSM 15929]
MLKPYSPKSPAGIYTNSKCLSWKGVKMKIIINENERGFLFKNGRFKKMLIPGKHSVSPVLGETFFKTTIFRMVNIKEVDMSVLLKDKNFADSVIKAEVPDSYLALHYEDGRILDTLRPGTYYFWKIFHEHTFKLIDISTPAVNLPNEIMSVVPGSLFTQIAVAEGETGLLFFDGKYKEQIFSGNYCFWNTTVRISCQLVDIRTQQLDVNSQEILTADKVTLRLNFVCNFRVTDAVSIINVLKDYKTQIYVTTQLALREYVGRLKFDELLEQKDSLASFVLEKLREKQDSLFVEFTDAGLKDIILPGEIRDIMNTVLIAEKNAQANVISRREEVASTRSLLNTAKLMEENTTLYKLKELEYLEKICDKVGSISIGNVNLLGQLSELINTRRV